jgi:hypothetical protein
VVQVVALAQVGGALGLDDRRHQQARHPLKVVRRRDQIAAPVNYSVVSPALAALVAAATGYSLTLLS